MWNRRNKLGVAVLMMVLGLVVVLARVASSHCDTLDGPVVSDARAALDKGDVTPVLKWVTKDNEGEIRAAFKRTLAVRAKGADAKELADMYFFETLVRLHRAGEGAPYSGLKPAGQVEPVVKAADDALAAGSADALAKEIGKAAETGVRERFARVLEAKKHAGDSVEAGREYVEAYVGYVHYVEALHVLIASRSVHHEGAKD